MVNEERKKLGVSGSKVDQILDSMLADIMNGVYKAGDKLPNEFELMEQYGVSRGPLREAIKTLCAMGVAEIRRGDGTYIASQMNPSIFDKVIYSVVYGMSSKTELLELRRVLDDATVRMAIEKITPDEIDRLYINVDKMTKAAFNGDIELMLKYDYEFHMLLIDFTKNIFFIRLVKGVYSLFQSTISEVIVYEKSTSKAPFYHRQIVDCIKEKRSEDVDRIVKQSLQTWQQRL